MKIRTHLLILLFLVFLTSYSFAKERVVVKEVVQLTTDGNYKYCPSWSPSGDKLALTMKKDENFDIYVLDLNKSEFTRLTYDKGIDGEPRWSPQGEKILFESNRTGEWSIWCIDANGENEKLLVSRGKTSTWLPDGKNFIFDREIPVSEKIHNELQLKSIETGEEKSILENSVRKIYPACSPDGKKLAFLKRSDGNSELWITDLDTNEEERVVSDGAFPAWSPDNKMVTFVTRGNNYNNIEVYDLETKEQFLLLENYGHVRSPSWSPDGKKIAFISNKSGNYEIWLMVLSFEE